jgi:isopentenyl-diphosphate Delta-isomerase
MNNDAIEFFDFVDHDDCVVGRASRQEVHQKKLMHRSVHIFVFNSSGNLFLQKRAETKDESPGVWDTSSSGHVDSGEDYITAANRELMEELNICEPLSFIMKLKAGPETFWEHVWSYRCVSEKKIHINLDEISEGRFWSPQEIDVAIVQDKTQFTPTFLTLWSHVASTAGE